MNPTVFREGGFRFYFFAPRDANARAWLRSKKGGEVSARTDHRAGPELRPITTGIERGASPCSGARVGWVRRSRNPTNWRTNVGLRDKAANPTYGLRAPTSPVEVTSVSKHGFWLLVYGDEVFLLFAAFPWFKNTPIGKLLNVELASAHHLYWPDLDIDLAVESLFQPERFPFISRINA